MKNIFRVTIKSLIIILFVFLSTSYVHIIETKVYTDSINKNVNISTMALKVEEFIENDIYAAKDTYTGHLTGYVYNCPLCTGQLYCNYKYDLSGGVTTYKDSTYGTVRIVASSSNLPCGSIIRFQTNRISPDPVYAIVLDRGVRGNAIDLLSVDTEYAIQLGRSTITYDVLREGWGKSK